MKKFLAIFLTLMLILSMGIAAFADLTYTDAETVTITKEYNATNEGTTSPAETFNFTIEKTSVSDAASGVTVANMPLPEIGSVEYAAGDAGSENKSKDITVKLPDYSSVGIYTYTISETAGRTAGVDYYGEPIKLVVTVIQQGDGKVRVAGVHTEGTGETKSDNFPNLYSAGSLKVSKTVTGNMGDRTKEFDVTVTFTAPTGKDVTSTINYVEDGISKTIGVNNWENGTATAVIKLKHDETITFTNIPYGVTYTVQESDYTIPENGGYSPASYTYSDETKKIDSAEDTVGITNNKGVTVDTGITMDSLPYIMLIAFVAVIGAVMLIKRIKASND